MPTLPFEDAKTRKLAKLTIFRLDEDGKASDLKNLFNQNILNVSADSLFNAGTSVFTAMYNPETFSRNYVKKIIPKETISTGSKPELVQVGINNEQISFKLLLDATGASPSAGIMGKNISSLLASAANGVDILIEQLKKTVFTTTATEHTGAKVLIVWGVNRFVGRVTSLTANYKLFDRSGRPLRAEVEVKILEDDLISIKETIEKFQSPDVTKTYTVKAGDTLTLLAKKMYEDESLYLEIARINGLTNYRKLTPGQVLVFPPINKEEL
ncbi:MAG: LysM peptidoglycan-binding domain-containing protein [Bacteroidota bacterium]|jgi:LysM repeat protein